VLHRIAFPVVSEWYQQRHGCFTILLPRARIRSTPITSRGTPSSSQPSTATPTGSPRWYATPPTAWTKRWARRPTGGLLMSGRRSDCDSGEPNLWSNGSVFIEPSASMSIDPSLHIPLQQTTATADCDDIDPYARHRQTPPRCDYALIHGCESR
jgi:hypothetical protein